MALPLERPSRIRDLLDQGIATLRGWPWRLLGALGGMGLLFLLLVAGYQATARPATLVVDGAILTVRTQQRLVGGVLAQAGITLSPGDEVFPVPDAPWRSSQAIVVQRAFTVTVRVDGRDLSFRGRPRSLLEVLVRGGVSLHPGDAIDVNSMRVDESSYADEAALQSLLYPPARTPHQAAPVPPLPALLVEVTRAVPLFVQDQGLELELRTTAATIGEALEEAGFRLYRADQIYPSLDAPVSAGRHVYISRAIRAQITVDGHSYATRTRCDAVAELLREEGIVLGPMDRVHPTPETPLRAGMSIQVIRITTLDLKTKVPIPYQHLQEADPSRELDDYHLRPGKEGAKEQVTRVTYEDGKEVRRVFLGERVAREPVDQVLYYGTRIVVRALQTPEGPAEYWRRIRVLATHYYPSTCDKAPDHPEYGITYTGKRATRGIIAVDPRLIPLHTRLYVPGYGFGAAEDIGGAIKGRHIDVCFDDADQGKGLWDTHYVDVYLLTPVPPLERIPWVIP